MNNPINRTTIQTADNKYKLYPKTGPCCYKKSDGTYDHIDLTFNDTTSTIGDISLLEKNVVSVGMRKDNNPHKYVGIRPDNNQADGTQQLEFSLINVELDGESQSFNCDTDYEVNVRGANIKQLVKINKTFKDFKIEFDIHAKGLPIVNGKYTEETIIRDYAFNINDLGEIEAGNTEHTLDNIFTESKDIPYIDCCLCKVTNDYITTGEYSTTEEFGESDLSDYVLDDLYSSGSSVYYKDCIILIAKCYNIVNYMDILLKNLCSIYGLEIFNDGGSGLYLTKNGKKVMGYFAKGGNEFLLFVNTKEIPDSIKSLFKRKTFNDTSYLDITLDEFKQSLKTALDLSLQLKVNSDYYQPLQDVFTFKISDEHFYIHLPVLFDESYNSIDLETTHTLKDNGDGSYRYTKYFNTQGRLLNTGNIKYIDTNVYVSAYPVRPRTANAASRSASYLAGFRNATAISPIFGSMLGNILGDNVHFICGDTSTRTASGQGGASYSTSYYQTYYLFDSSGITSTVTDLSWKHISIEFNSEIADCGDMGVIALKAVVNGVIDGDSWNDMTGHTSGWDASDVTEYSAEHVITANELVENSVTWIKANTPNGGWHETEFNADAKTDIEDDDSFRFVFLDHDQYYSNSIVGDYGQNATNFTGARWFRTAETDNSIVADRPYLDVTVAGGAAVTYNANFFGTNF